MKLDKKLKYIVDAATNPSHIGKSCETVKRGKTIMGNGFWVTFAGSSTEYFVLGVKEQ